MKEIKMKGWKTKTSGIGIILTGLGTVAAGLAIDPFDMNMVISGTVIAFGGLSAIGLGHKADKLSTFIELLGNKRG